MTNFRLEDLQSLASLALGSLAVFFSGLISTFVYL